MMDSTVAREFSHAKTTTATANTVVVVVVIKVVVVLLVLLGCLVASASALFFGCCGGTVVAVRQPMPLLLLMQPYNTLSGSPSILSRISSSFADDDDDEPGKESLRSLVAVISVIDRLCLCVCGQVLTAAVDGKAFQEPLLCRELPENRRLG